MSKLILILFNLRGLIRISVNERTTKRDNDYLLWKVTMKLKRSITHIPPIRTEERGWAEDRNLG